MLKCLVCVILLLITDDAICKPDYLFSHEVEGWLKLHHVPATWHDAFFNCHYEGAVLASPTSPKLASALNIIVRESKLDAPIFLGVHAITPGVFTSVEGVSLDDLSVNWGTYTSKTSSGCLSLNIYGDTYISSCSELRPYVCYKRRDNTTILNQCGTFDDDYHLFQATGSCYKYHRKPRSWWVAHRICVAEGGHLVVVDDKKEADIVTSIMYKPNITMSWFDAAHVGLIDRGKDHSFFTVNGKKIEDVYNTWAMGQPDNKGVNICVMIYPEGTLDDVNCGTELMKFICEKDPNNSRFENISGDALGTSLNSCCDETCCNSE